MKFEKVQLLLLIVWSHHIQKGGAAIFHNAVKYRAMQTDVIRSKIY